MLVKIEQKYLENLTYHIREHSIIKFALRGEGDSIEMGTYASRGKGDYVHKLLAIITRFFVGFVRISALLICSKKLYLVFFFFFGL